MWSTGTGTTPGQCKPGDLDKDGALTSQDAEKLALYLAGEQPPASCPIDPYGDLDSDQTIRASDLVRLQALSAPAPVPAPRAEVRKVKARSRVQRRKGGSR